ncbi:hypothetical protein BDZ91DRAFT_841518 [Kalaharituber pfeilii]|nr:hypothetical protein BDZ91DRAFT_841518 [Kalaharituber pfeilii]
MSSSRAHILRHTSSRLAYHNVAVYSNKQYEEATLNGSNDTVTSPQKSLEPLNPCLRCFYWSLIRGGSILQLPYRAEILESATVDSNEEALLLLQLPPFEVPSKSPITSDLLPILSVDHLLVKAAAKLYWFGKKRDPTYLFGRLSLENKSVCHKIVSRAVTQETLPYFVEILQEENAKRYPSLFGEFEGRNSLGKKLPTYFLEWTQFEDTYKHYLKCFEESPAAKIFYQWYKGKIDITPELAQNQPPDLSATLPSSTASSYNYLESLYDDFEDEDGDSTPTPEKQAGKGKKNEEITAATVVAQLKMVKQDRKTCEEKDFRTETWEETKRKLRAVEAKYKLVEDPIFLNNRKK